VLRPGDGRRRAARRPGVPRRDARLHALGDPGGQLLRAARHGRQRRPADAALVVGRAAEDVTDRGRGAFSRQMARIKMVDESEAAGRLAELYAGAKSNSAADVVADLLRRMS